MEPFGDEDWSTPESNGQDSILRDNIDSAKDLFGFADKPLPTSFIPRTRDQVESLAKETCSRITQLRASSLYFELVSSIVTDITKPLGTNQIKKLVAKLQTLLNTQLGQRIPLEQNPSTKKPSLRYGGSTKSSFEHDFNDYDEDEDYDKD